MTIRTYGLSGSGLDVDKMVSDLIRARRIPYDKLYQKKTQLEWKKTDYNTMYTELNNLRSTVYTNKLQGTLAPKKATSSAESVATVTANADAASVNHTLVVTTLADGVKKSSSANITTGSNKDTLNNQVGTDQTGGTSFTVKITNGTLSKEITVDPTKSIYEFVSSINNAGINVKANYDSTLDRFFIYTTNTGSSSQIDFTGSSAIGLNFLQNDLLLDTTTQNGVNAAITLDSVSLTPSSNTVTVSGVTYTLKATGTTTVSIIPDTDKAVANIKSFIDSYNSTLSKVNGELNETLNKDYLPLTSEQKKAMTETQIKDWETLAKSGMLRRDLILTDAVTRMRSDFSGAIQGLSGKYNSAASIGITTGGYTENGKLYLDETKLKNALNEDPDAVYKIFGTDGSTASSDGIATRLYDSLKTILDKLNTKAGVPSTTGAITVFIDNSALGKSINDYNKQMTDLDSRLKQIEDRYYRQFNAMEQALNQMTSQSAWLAQQFGGK